MRDLTESLLFDEAGSIMDCEGSAPAHRQLCDSLFNSVYFVDKDCRITYWNHGAEQPTGDASDEALGSN